VAELTLEQQRALALARARLQIQGQEAAPAAPVAPAPQMTQLDAAGQAARAGFLANFNDELAGGRAAAVAGLPQSVQNALNVPSVGLAGIARAVAPSIGGVRMLAERVFPQTFGSRATEAYAPARDVERALDKAAEEQFPNTYFGANIAGSAVMPLGLLGRGVKTTIAAGGGAGAASGFGRGEGAEDRLEGAAIEGGLGAALGAVPAVAMGTFNAGQRIVAPRSFAERLVRRTIGADRARGVEDVLTPADIAAARAAGQDIVVGDLGATGTLRLARAAGNTSEDAGARLRASTDPRYTEQKGRFGDFIEDLFGGNLNMTSTNDTLRDTARRVNAPLYRAAYQAGESADLWNPTLDRIAQSPAVQAAIRDVEKKAADRAVLEGDLVIRNPFSFDDQGRMTWGMTPDGGQIRPNLQFWDQVQRNLREAADAAPRGGDEARVLNGIRRRLNEELDAAVPEFGKARGMARQFFGAEDALEAGQTFFRQNRAIQLSDTQKAFRAMSGPEQELFRRGFAAELANTVRNAPDSRDVVKLFDGANRRKLEVVMPADELRQLEAFVRREGIMNRLRSATQGNSSTAQQLRDMSVGAGAGAGVGIFTAADPLTTGGTALLGGLLARIRSGVNENVMREVGEILSSSDPERINRLLSGPNGGAIMGALRSLSQAVSNIGGGARASAAPRTEPTVNVPQPQRMLPPPEPQRLLPPPDGFAKGGRVKEPKMSPIVEAIIEEMGKRMAPEGARRAAAIGGYSRGGAVQRVARALAERLVPEGGEATRGGLAAARAADAPPAMSGISPPGMASAADINRAARTSGDLTYKQLGELYDTLRLTGGGASPLVRKGLASQSDEAIDAATRLKLADRETISQAVERHGKTFTFTDSKGKPKTVPTTEALFAGKLPGMRMPSQEAAEASGKLAEGARIAREVNRAATSYDAEVGGRGVLYDLSPATLNRMPDVPQFDLPRAAPKATERLEGLEREGPARLRRYIEAGGEAGRGWYNLQQLRDDFRAMYGPTEGDERFRLWTLVNASTSMTNPIESNVRTASHYLNRALRGEPLPQVVQVSDPRTGKTVQTLAGDLPPPYGAKAQVQHAQRTREFLGGDMDPVSNPKPISYQQNLLGNWRPITSDTHYIRDIVGPGRFDLFKDEAALLPGEYAYLERMGQKVAKGQKIAPAQAQSAAWVGGGKDTGLKSEPIPYLQALQKRIGITARIRGEPIDVTYNKFLRGEIDLYAEGGKVKKPKQKGGLAAARRARAG
jgi:hypothetical protein